MGISKSLTFQYQGISSVLALLAQMACIASIDKIGRRWAMIGGNLANCLFFTIATIMLAVFPPATNSNASASWAFIAVTWLYNISFSATNGPLSWIVPAEIFDTRTRSKGVSIGVMVSFAFNTMIGQVTPIAMERIGWRFYILFVVCNFTNAVYFWATQPETKKRPLEEMNYLFTNAPYVFDCVSMVVVVVVVVVVGMIADFYDQVVRADDGHEGLHDKRPAAPRRGGREEGEHSDTRGGQSLRISMLPATRAFQRLSVIEPGQRLRVAHWTKDVSIAFKVRFTGISNHRLDPIA
jgi:MFS family permease